MGSFFLSLIYVPKLCIFLANSWHSILHKLALGLNVASSLRLESWALLDNMNADYNGSRKTGCS